MLSKLEDTQVTNNESLRYSKQTTTSNIISNKIADVFSIWKSKRLVLVPSLILLLFVGAFSLSPRLAKDNLSLEQLVAQEEQIEKLETSNNYDDWENIDTIASFDEQAINDLSTI
jgi:hypothetical protein